jgi:release factor glutamine methyltransferase
VKILELLDKTTDFFKQKGLESPRLQIELILSHVLKLPRMGLYLQFERELTTAELDTLRPLVKRRAEREPLQHILGETNFYGQTFYCNKEALIPRPETEVLVEWVLEVLKEQSSVTLYDIGTGTGIIALTLAKHLPDWNIIGIDISATALDLARKNQTRLENTTVSWLTHDLLPATEDQHVIVANLPYLTDAEMISLPKEVTFDPSLALHGGQDGLDLIRKLISMANTKTSHLFLEAGANHDLAISALLKQAGFPQVTVRKDLNGIPRFILGQRH